MSDFKPANQTITPMSADPGEEFPFLHTITVVDRVVSVDKPELVQNNIKTETVTLNLDSEWEGLSTVINIGNEQPVSVIWSGEPVVVPAELMTTVGSLDVSVVGYGDDGGIRAVTKKATSIFNVVASGYVEGDEAVPDPTTILGQLIQAADNANQAADRFNQASEDIEGIGPAVEKVQASEANAKQSETNAASSAQSASQSASAAAASAEAARTSETNAADSATEASEASTAAKASETNAASSASAASQSASAAKASETNAASSATAAQNAVDNFGLEAGTTTTGEPGTDAEVEIIKDGTKYKANFTIPRGADGTGGSGGSGGGLSSVTHDSTLLGDGTSSNPLKLAKGTILTLNAVDRNTDDGSTFDLNDALEGFTRVVGLKKNLVNLPNLDYISGNYATGLVLTTTIGAGNKIQLWFDAKTSKGKIHIRSYVQPNWTVWNTTSMESALSNYVPLSTYQALEARVQALEAKLANQ